MLEPYTAPCGAPCSCVTTAVLYVSLLPATVPVEETVAFSGLKVPSA